MKVFLIVSNVYLYMAAEIAMRAHPSLDSKIITQAKNKDVML